MVRVGELLAHQVLWLLARVGHSMSRLGRKLHTGRAGYSIFIWPLLHRLNAWQVGKRVSRALWAVRKRRRWVVVWLVKSLPVTRNKPEGEQVAREKFRIPIGAGTKRPGELAIELSGSRTDGRV